MKHSVYFVSIFATSINAFVLRPSALVGRNEVSSQIHLFDGPPSTAIAQEFRPSSTRKGIPYGSLESLENGACLPFDFEHRNSAGLRTTVRLQQLEQKDVSTAVGLCLKEYGSYPSSTTAKDDPISKMIKAKMDDFDNFLFSFVVLLGLGQRVERREKSDSDPDCPQDHNVISISEVDSNGDEKMFGMAEVSLQPPDPARTSPPFVVPSFLKNNPKPYISNVLVTNEYRGNGYSKVLMACCEGLARQWGYEEVYLHVDADQGSGRSAQCLYRSLDYMPVIDEEYNKNFTWMGIDSINRGLYIVDGVALLFLKKALISKNLMERN